VLFTLSPYREAEVTERNVPSHDYLDATATLTRRNADLLRSTHDRRNLPIIHAGQAAVGRQQIRCKAVELESVIQQVGGVRQPIERNVFEVLGDVG